MKRQIFSFSAALRWMSALLGLWLLCAGAAYAADTVLSGPGVQLRVSGTDKGQYATALRILIALTILSLAPAILVCMTSFIRIIVVLSMLRHGFGMPETPPNTVLVSLALFLTFFTMTPTVTQVNEQAVQPYLANKLTDKQALAKAIVPLREFMVRQTRESDLALMVEISKSPPPKTIEDISMVQLIPAFMLSELRVAFQIGFIIFLPFLLIDLVVAAALMSLGMMMMPPTSIALPLKILLFVMIDGWSLVTRALLSTFA